MKLIIEIDENDYEKMKNGYVPSTFNTFSVIKNGTPIPETATNGEVIKAMFPNVNIYEHNGGTTYSVNNEYNFNATWWNAPYQKGGKNDNNKNL